MVMKRMSEEKKRWNMECAITEVPLIWSGPPKIVHVQKERFCIYSISPNVRTEDIRAIIEVLH